MRSLQPGGAEDTEIFKLVMIATGGAVGATLRYFISGWAQKFTDGSFPTGTFVVNLLGCAAIGIAGAFFAGPHAIREEYRIALLIGFLGAFTTFSTFGWETFSLANGAQVWLAAVNISFNNSLGLLAVWLGYRMAEPRFGA